MSNPTAAEKRYFAKLVDFGCVACHLDGLHTAPEIHHARLYGYRDHSQVYPLCPAHHRPTAAVPGVPNRHGNPIEFAARYGTDDELVIYCRSKIKKP